MGFKWVWEIVQKWEVYPGVGVCFRMGYCLEMGGGGIFGKCIICECC